MGICGRIYYQSVPAALVVVLIGGVYAAAVQTVFLFPGDSPVPTLVWLPALLGALVALGLAVVTVRTARGRRGVSWVGASQSRLPRAARIGVLVTYTVAVLAVLVLTVAAGVNDVPPGQPVITSDGRRVQMPVDSGLVDVSILGLLRSLRLGLDGLLGLVITGSRRENGGTRR